MNVEQVKEESVDMDELQKTEDSDITEAEKEPETNLANDEVDEIEESDDL